MDIPIRSVIAHSNAALAAETPSAVHDVNPVLNLGGVAYENYHATVFHAWLNMQPDPRFEALRDRYVFFSVCVHLGSYLGDLIRADVDRANDFVAQIISDVTNLADGKIAFCEEWFRGLEELVGTFSDRNYIPEARHAVAIGFRTGVIKFPRIAQSMKVHAAYLDALIGRRDKAAKVALEIVHKPFLLPNRRELPGLYHKLMYILSSSNHLSEYRMILWRGVSNIHANGPLRDAFSGQIVKTYRGAFRALLRGNVPLIYRFPFLLANLARMVAALSPLAAFNVHVPLRWLHLASLYLIDYISYRSPAGQKAFIVSNTPSHDVSPARVTRQSVQHRIPFNRKILITRAMGGIGDLLMMTPGLMALVRKYPNAQIDFAIPKSFHAVFEGLEAVRVLDINEEDIRLSSYQRWINLTDCPAGRVESLQYPNVRRNRIEIFARAMGVSKLQLRMTAGFRPFYRVTPEEAAWAKRYIDDINPRGLPVIGVQPFAADSYRNWPYMEKCVEELARNNVVLVFHHEEFSGYNFGNVAKIVMPIRKSVALAAQCERLLVLDSSFLHFSAALDVPTVVIFGAISGRLRTKDYPNVRLVAPRKSEFPCYPCWRHEHKPCHLTNGRESICFRSIGPERVIAALNSDGGKWRVVPGMWTRFKTWMLYGRE